MTPCPATPGADKFVIEANSGADRITDFAHIDRIVFEASSGVNAFSQLVFTAVGQDTKITWGTSDSLTIVGLRPKDLTSADFTFGPAAASSLSTMAVSSELSRVTSATSDAMLMGTVAAVGLMSVQAQAQPLSTFEQSGIGASGPFSVAAASGPDLSSVGIGSSFVEASRFALGGEMRELVNTGPANSPSSFAEQSFSLDALGSVDQARGMQIGTTGDTFSAASFGSGAFAGLATGVAIPAAGTLLAAMGGVDSAGGMASLDQARGTAEMWRGLGDVLDGQTGHAIAIDALLDSLPGHDGTPNTLAASLAVMDTMVLHWMPDVGMSTMDAIAAHPDAVAMG